MSAPVDFVSTGAGSGLPPLGLRVEGRFCTLRHVPRYLVDAIGIAALAAAFTVLAAIVDSWAPFAVLFVAMVALRFAMDWRPLRVRLPWWRPFGFEANRLARRGRDLRRADMDPNVRREEAQTWERDVWALIERHSGDKGIALHRRNGDIPPDANDADVVRLILHRCDLLESIVIGTA